MLQVSYRAVLNETTSKRQQSLYITRGLNLNRYEELSESRATARYQSFANPPAVDDAKELRKQIKRVAGDVSAAVAPVPTLR